MFLGGVQYTSKQHTILLPCDSASGSQGCRVTGLQVAAAGVGGACCRSHGEQLHRAAKVDHRCGRCSNNARGGANFLNRKLQRSQSEPAARQG